MGGKKDDKGAGAAENQEGYQVAQENCLTFKTRPSKKRENNDLESGHVEQEHILVLSWVNLESKKSLYFRE